MRIITPITNELHSFKVIPIQLINNKNIYIPTDDNRTINYTISPIFNANSDYTKNYLRYTGHGYRQKARCEQQEQQCTSKERRLIIELTFIAKQEQL